MFWGFFLSIALFTLFWNRSLWLGVLFLGCIFSYFTYRSIASCGLYIAGCLLAGGALLSSVGPLPHMQSTPLLITTTGLVLEQRNSDTRLVETSSGDLLLRTTTPLLAGQYIGFSSKLTLAGRPSWSWSTITLPVFLEDEFQFAPRLAMKHYLGRGYASRVALLSFERDALPRGLRRKDDIKHWVNNIFGRHETAALLVGMLTGERSGFSREQYDSFVTSGLVHLVAVSGSNIVWISLLFMGVFFWLPYYMRTFLLFCLLLLYGQICGADSSVVRSISMSLLGLFATWIGRPVMMTRLLLLVGVGMLVRNPLLLWYDLGFSLSFCAVIGIFFLSTWSKKYLLGHHSPRWGRLWSGRLMPTLGASAGTILPLLLFTGKISLTSIGINLLIAPFVPLYLFLGGVVLGVHSFLPLIGKTIPLLEWATDSLFTLAKRGSTQGVFVETSTPWMRLGVVVCLMGIVLSFWRLKPRTTS